MEVRAVYDVPLPKSFWAEGYEARLEQHLPIGPDGSPDMEIYHQAVEAYIAERQKPPVEEFLRWAKSIANFEYYMVGTGTAKLGAAENKLDALASAFSELGRLTVKRTEVRCVLLRFMGPWRGACRSRMLVLLPIGSLVPLAVVTGRLLVMTRHLEDLGVQVAWDQEMDVIRGFANVDDAEDDTRVPPPLEFTESPFAGEVWIQDPALVPAPTLAQMREYGIAFGQSVFFGDAPVQVSGVFLTGGKFERLVRGVDDEGNETSHPICYVHLTPPDDRYGEDAFEEDEG